MSLPARDDLVDHRGWFPVVVRGKMIKLCALSARGTYTDFMALCSAKKRGVWRSVGSRLGLPFLLVLGGLVLAGCADWTEDLNPWDTDTSENEPVPGEEEDFPNLGSVPDPPEDVTTLEEIEQVEQSLLADSANAQYTTGTYQRADDETTIEPMPDPPVVEEEIVEEVVEEVVVEEEVDGEVVEEVIIEEDVEVEVDEGAALEVIETEEVAVVEAEPEIIVVDEQLAAVQPAAGETAVEEVDEIEVASVEPEIMQSTGSPDEALEPQRVTRSVTEVEAVVESAAGDTTETDVVLIEETAAVETAPAQPAEETVVVDIAAVERTDQGGMSQTFDSLFAASGPETVVGGSGETSAVTVNEIPIASAPAPTITATGYRTLVAVIKFGNGSSALDNNDRRIIKDLANAHRQRGGGIHLAGYASHHAGADDNTDELLANFNVSVDRATAVADELVRQGVSSDDILIDAQGDQAFVNVASNQPDEADQRRVDIYFTN